MNETMKTILSRRSCRNFMGRQLEDEILNPILEAGTWAASGMGKQSARMVVIQDEKLREKLRRMNAAIQGRDGDPFYGAPTIVLVLADSTVHTWVEDGSLVIGNLMLAAESLGVGSCWIHRAREMFDSDEGKAMLKEWGIPETYRGVGHCALGYAAAPAPAYKPRREDAILRL